MNIALEATAVTPPKQEVVRTAAPGDFPPRRLFHESIADYAIRDALLRHAHQIRGRVLDLGCGDRRYEKVFAAATQGWTGLDWPGNPHMVTADVIGDALRVPFASESFDTVLCTQVLEHVPEPLDLLREAQRLLKPGGKLILTAPQYNCLHEEPRDFYRYTRYGLDHLLSRAGFQVNAIDPIGGFVSLFAFILTLHSTIFRLPLICGVFQWLSWHVDRKFFRPKDCIGYAAIAQRPAGDIA